MFVCTNLCLCVCDTHTQTQTCNPHCTCVTRGNNWEMLHVTSASTLCSLAKTLPSREEKDLVIANPDDCCTIDLLD